MDALIIHRIQFDMDALIIHRIQFAFTITFHSDLVFCKKAKVAGVFFGQVASEWYRVC